MPSFHHEVSEEFCRDGIGRELSAPLQSALFSALLKQALPHVGAFAATPGALSPYDGCEARIQLGFPGETLVGRAFQGDVPRRQHAVLRISFASRDAWISTDRHRLPPGQRLPVLDRFDFLFRLSEAWQDDSTNGISLLNAHSERRIVPVEITERAQEMLSNHAVFHRYMSELSQRSDGPETTVSTATPPGLLRRMRSKATAILTPSKSEVHRTAHQADPGQQQKVPDVKFFLHQWVPKGTWELKTLFPQARHLEADTLELRQDSMVMTVEIHRGKVSRHVPELFRGAMLLALVTQAEIAWMKDSAI